MRKLTILGICGSLRNDSYNKHLLEALAGLLPTHFQMNRFPIETLPFFNPDLDDAGVRPNTVERWKESITSANAVVIVSPEYAHAIPGVLKNALDWVVGSGELVDKPVAVINATPTHLGAQMAHDSLIYLIRLLSANLLDNASFRVASVNNKVNSNGEVIDRETLRLLKQTVALLQTTATI